jgi:hypothetical protein
MPGTARIIDRLRAEFGAVVVRYAREDDLEVGVPYRPDPSRTMNADQWLRYVKTGEAPEGKESPWPSRSA